jgi:hypothetical protein
MRTRFLIVIFSAGAFFLGARYVWSEWTLYAVAITALLLLGGVRFWPWHVERVREIGVGLVIGLIAAAIEFL